MKKFSLLVMSAFFVLLTVPHALAEISKHTKTTTTTTVESDDDAYSPPADAAIPPPNLPPPSTAPAPTAGNYTQAQMTQTFGSKSTAGTAGCKTEALSKDVIKDLKRECATWVKEQKTDLGKDYLGNTCEDSCDDCGMSLVRCKVTGSIRYRKAD